MDTPNSPVCPFESRVRLVEAGRAERLAAAVAHIRDEFPQRSLLDECLAFAEHNLDEAVSADIESLMRVGYFPWVEAAREFDQAMDLALSSHYKGVYDHLRRALELVLVGAFFSSELTTRAEAVEWMTSIRETPLFTKTLKRVRSLARFRDLDAATSWGDMLQAFYWKLCDIVHVRGMAVSYNSIQPSFHIMGGKCLPAFDAVSLSRALNAFIDSVRHACAIIAASNPILLVGLPMDEKFGLNGPASGFFNDCQAARFNRLLPDETKAHFVELAKVDSEVRAIELDIRSRPDVVDYDF